MLGECQNALVKAIFTHAWKYSFLSSASKCSRASARLMAYIYLSDLPTPKFGFI